ncbi:hypothetical protein LPW11_15530 [Geomonas sp. RF6]|uniref:hypothetical protein n=1 Tax=Geomonas sp. RF6 TaxID=2897342 RepID=UPI001E387575|nr:hypothetical protein [Geomonas sp. RF6]UFS69298.1 hypothetical protein LPW11_15530 [Geomonas sp. RF6]
MSLSLPERDWKYLRNLRETLLATLYRRINESAAQILASATLSEHEKYVKLYKHMEDSDRVVADCFDDWRRSNLLIKLLLLRQHKLLSEEQLSGLSGEVRARLQLLP